MWEVTALDARDVARMRAVIYEAEIFRDTLVRPVHAVVEPAPDPDFALSAFDSTLAEMRGEPVDPADYPSGTWFYYGTDRVGVRLAGSERLARVEARSAHTE